MAPNKADLRRGSHQDLKRLGTKRFVAEEHSDAGCVEALLRGFRHNGRSHHRPRWSGSSLAHARAMSLDLLRERGIPIDEQTFDWRDLVRTPYSKLDDD